jgi:hypothetical protein
MAYQTLHHETPLNVRYGKNGKAIITGGGSGYELIDDYNKVNECVRKTLNDLDEVVAVINPDKEARLRSLLTTSWKSLKPHIDAAVHVAFDDSIIDIVKLDLDRVYYNCQAALQMSADESRPEVERISTCVIAAKNFLYPALHVQPGDIGGFLGSVESYANAAYNLAFPMFKNRMSPQHIEKTRKLAKKYAALASSGKIHDKILDAIRILVSKNVSMQQREAAWMTMYPPPNAVSRFFHGVFNRNQTPAQTNGGATIVSGKATKKDALGSNKTSKITKTPNATKASKVTKASKARKAATKTPYVNKITKATKGLPKTEPTAHEKKVNKYPPQKKGA